MNDILQLCSDVLKKHGINNVRISFTEDGNYNMYYDINKKEISINEKMLRSESIDYSIPFMDYAEIIFLHELGHALDKELQYIYQDINYCYEKLKANPFSDDKDQLLLRIKNNKIKSERNAWKIAEEMIDERLKKAFIQIKNNSLKKFEETASLEVEKIKSFIEIKQLELIIDEFKK
jgi:hypothetical protein